MLDIEGN